MLMPSGRPHLMIRGCVVPATPASASLCYGELHGGLHEGMHEGLHGSALVAPCLA